MIDLKRDFLSEHYAHADLCTRYVSGEGAELPVKSSVLYTSVLVRLSGEPEVDGTHARQTKRRLGQVAGKQAGIRGTVTVISRTGKVGALRK